MWNDLDGASEVVAATLLLDNVLVNLSGGDVVLAGKGDVQVTLVVSEIKIDFSAVVEDEALPVPVLLSDSVLRYLLRSVSCSHVIRFCTLSKALTQLVP